MNQRSSGQEPKGQASTDSPRFLGDPWSQQGKLEATGTSSGSEIHGGRACSRLRQARPSMRTSSRHESWPLLGPRPIRSPQPCTTGSEQVLLLSKNHVCWTRNRGTSGSSSSDRPGQPVGAADWCYRVKRRSHSPAGPGLSLQQCPAGGGCVSVLRRGGRFSGQPQLPSETVS